MKFLAYVLAAPLVLCGCQQVQDLGRVFGGPDQGQGQHTDMANDLSGQTGGPPDLSGSGPPGDMGGTASHGYCDPNGWCLLYPMLNNALNAVWVTSPGDVWAVGQGSTILHYDGATWIGVPSDWGSGQLTGVWASGPADVWAVGSLDDSAVLHWNGAAWSEVSISQTSLNSVWGSGSTDVWAVGPAGAILHWNGTAWTASQSGVTDNLAGLWGSSSTDVWTGPTNSASPYLLHWNGTSWQKVTVPAFYGGGGIFGTGPTNVWATGLHYDGTSWKAAGTAGSPLWGSSPTDMWFTDSAGLLVHWNGSAFASVAVPGSASAIAGMGSGSGNLWVVGMNGAILHFDGASWTEVPTQSSLSFPSEFQAVWASASNDVWAVGFSNSGAAVLHFDGTAWTQSSPSGVPDDGGIWGSGPSDIWIVGGGGIAHYNGSQWTPVPPQNVNLWAIWGSGPSDVWAVGEGDLTLHYNGSAWTSVPNPLSQSSSVGLSSVSGSGPDDVWAAGTGGLIHWNGTAWSVVNPGNGLTISQVLAFSPTDAWSIQQDANTITHWDGTRWSVAYTFNPSPPAGLDNLSGIGGSGPSDIWVGTQYLTPELLHWDGTSWTVVRLTWPMGQQYAVMSGLASGQIYLIGGQYSASVILGYQP